MKYLTTVYGLLPPNFRRSRLGDVCDPTDGIQTGPFGSQLHQKDYVTDGNPIITVEHLGENRISHQDLPCVTEHDGRRLSKYVLRKGDIVFSRVGSVDRRSLVRDEEDGWLFSGRCLRVRPNPDVIDSGYLSYFFGLPAFQDHMRSVAVGATMPSLNTKILSDVDVPYPPLPEQRAIAHILGTLDDKIELNRRMNQTLEAMARAIFQDWFVDFGPVRAKVEGQDPYLPSELWDLFPDDLVDSELGEIPEGWDVKPLGEISKAVKGRSYKSSQLADSDTALVTLKSFGRGGGYQPEGLKSFIGDYKPEQVVNPGEVIVACTDVTQAGQVIGHPALVEPDPKYRCLVASLDTIIVRPFDSNIGREFLYFLCGTESFINHTSAHSTGTTVLHLSKNAIPSYKMALPAQELLTQFRRVTNSFLELRMKNWLETYNLADQRNALIPKLMSGEVMTGH